MVQTAFLFMSFLFLQQVINEDVVGNEINSENSTINEFSVEYSGRVLSRRKRFLTFPDGSSFQLVFCCQTSAVIPIGDIFLFANTAALAWSLPTDPQFLYMFKDYERPLRRMDTVTYFDEDGRIVGKYPYRRKTIVNPAFAKRSVEGHPMTFKEKLKISIDKKRMHEKQSRRDYLNPENMDEMSKEFHRSNRVDLYEKIEKLFMALGRDGRQCVLYKLCEAAQRPPGQEGGQGTFLQEFLRVVFTLPKGKEFDYDDHREYDRAHNLSNDCETLYPGCEEFQADM